MIYFTDNLPTIRIQVKNSFLMPDAKGYQRGYLVAVTNVPSRPLLFTVHLDSGALYSRLPIDALVCDRFNPNLLPLFPFSLTELQPYSCLEGSIQVISYNFLKDSDAVARIAGKDVKGRYLFTVDVLGEGLSEDPEQFKTFNIINLENNQLAALPNNMVYFPNGFSADDKGWPKDIRRNKIYHEGPK